jgi:hypothetical protein
MSMLDFAQWGVKTLHLQELLARIRQWLTKSPIPFLTSERSQSGFAKNIKELLSTTLGEPNPWLDMGAARAKVERFSQSLSGKAAFLRRQIRAETRSGFVDRFLSRFSGTTITATDHGNTP